jgi:hypothetical protein
LRCQRVDSRRRREILIRGITQVDLKFKIIIVVPLICPTYFVILDLLSNSDDYSKIIIG